MKVRDLSSEALGSVVDAAVRAGGDSLRIQNISTELSTDVKKTAMQKARTLAVQDAIAAAGVLAQVGVPPDVMHAVWRDECWPGFGWAGSPGTMQNQRLLPCRLPYAGCRCLSGPNQVPRRPVCPTAAPACVPCRPCQ